MALIVLVDRTIEMGMSGGGRGRGGGLGGLKGTRVQSVQNLLKNPQFPLKSVLAIIIGVYQLYASRKYDDMLQ